MFTEKKLHIEIKFLKNIFSMCVDHLTRKKSYLFLGGYDTIQPWQAKWRGGVTVKFVGKNEPQTSMFS